MFDNALHLNVLEGKAKFCLWWGKRQWELTGGERVQGVGGGGRGGLHLVRGQILSGGGRRAPQLALALHTSMK